MYQKTTTLILGLVSLRLASCGCEPNGKGRPDVPFSFSFDAPIVGGGTATFDTLELTYTTAEGGAFTLRADHGRALGSWEDVD